MKRRLRAAVLLCTFPAFGWQGALATAPTEPETVMATFHARPGAEAALARIIADHFDTARALNLVLAEPHVTIRRNEGDTTAFVQIFTWRDASVPDHAPPAIQKIWAEMAKLTEPRGGRPGIDIVQVELVSDRITRPAAAQRFGSISTLSAALAVRPFADSLTT